MLLRTSVEFVAPSMFAPFFRHWYCRPTPDAVTLSNTLAPSVTLVPCGCEVMTGRATTVSVATVLVADPNKFVTTARYSPASAWLNPVNARTGFVAPKLFVKFNSHLYSRGGCPRPVHQRQRHRPMVNPTCPSSCRCRFRFLQQERYLSCPRTTAWTRRISIRERHSRIGCCRRHTNEGDRWDH